MPTLAICRQSTSKGTARGIEADVLRSSVAQRRRQQRACAFCQLESEIWEIKNLAALQCFKRTKPCCLRERSFPTGYLDNFQRCRRGGPPRNSATWILMRTGSERQERADTTGVANIQAKVSTAMPSRLFPCFREKGRVGSYRSDPGCQEQSSGGRNAVARLGKSGRKHLVL
jgi:hypothetical protein